jgi:hypothetical protein
MTWWILAGVFGAPTVLVLLVVIACWLRDHLPCRRYYR